MNEHDGLSVIDAHHHLWDLSRPGYRWLKGKRQDSTDPSSLGTVQRNYLLDDYLRDTAGVQVVGSVHVEANYGGKSPTEETAWLADTVTHSSIPTVFVAAARLQADDVQDVLNTHSREPRVRGIRQMLNWSPSEQIAESSDLMSNPEWRKGLALLAGRGFSFDLQVFPSQLAEAAALAADFPDTTFVLNHGGFLQQGDKATWGRWRKDICLLAERPNVVVKASSYVSVDRFLDLKGLRTFLSVLVDAFGIDRVMFGSNFPLDGRFVTYRELIDAHVGALEDTTTAERRAFFSLNANRVYRIDEVNGNS